MSDGRSVRLIYVLRSSLSAHCAVGLLWQLYVPGLVVFQRRVRKLTLTLFAVENHAAARYTSTDRRSLLKMMRVRRLCESHHLHGNASIPICILGMGCVECVHWTEINQNE